MSTPLCATTKCTGAEQERCDEPRPGFQLSGPGFALNNTAGTADCPLVAMPSCQAGNEAALLPLHDRMPHKP